MLRYSVTASIQLAIVSALVYAQAGQQQNPRDTWDKVYTANQRTPLAHNAFLSEVVKERKPGKALDIGIGEGRNALFLAAKGWDVTGFDVSEVGVRQARERAKQAGLKLNALVDDADRFDYGKERWDLIVGMYEHELITRNAAKIGAALRPGGLIVVEGVHRDAKRKGVGGDYYGHGPNELLRAFEFLRVLRYEEALATMYWSPKAEPLPIVRFVATKE